MTDAIKHWNEVRHDIHLAWRMISEKELAEAESVADVAELLQKKYGMGKIEALRKIEQITSRFAKPRHDVDEDMDDDAADYEVDEPASRVKKAV